MYEYLNVEGIANGRGQWSRAKVREQIQRQKAVADMGLQSLKDLRQLCLSGQVRAGGGRHRLEGKWKAMYDLAEARAYLEFLARINCCQELQGLYELWEVLGDEDAIQHD